MNSRRWQDHFQEAARAAETQASEPGTNPLVKILEQSLISEDEYLNWAQENFELPILKNSFFTDHAVDQDFWKKWQSRYSWQVDCLPVCEWDGILYVACLEPREFQAEMNAVCLLTSLQGLQRRWSEYQPVTAASALELQDEPTSLKSPVSETSENFEAPEGIELKTSTPAAEAPEALILESLSTADAVVAAATPPVTPAKVSLLTKTAPPSSSVFFLDSVLKKTPSPVNLQACFTAMKAHFEKCLLLAVDTLERTAKPVAWDESFKAPEIVTEISLTTPSLFRIANSTQRAYHGAVMQNEINDHFFAEWNQSKIPDHITLVPVLVQEHVVAMLMGFAGTEAFNRTSLQLVENLANDLTAQLSNGNQKAA